MPSIWRKTGGSWQKIKTVYRKTNGSWQSVRRVWRKTNGVWQLSFLQSITPSIQTRVELTSANTATQTVRLTGRLYHWVNATAVTYQFAKGTDLFSYTNISGASGTSTNPSSGSSNTNDQYTIAQADVTPNSANYYVYISKATNSTYGTEQTSTSDPIIVQAPRDLSLSSSKTGTSVTVSWTNDTYSGRYEWQYKLNSGSTWSSSTFLAPGTSTSSFTQTGLTNSTFYDFRVRGWTGTSNSYGYYGNWNNITVETSGPAAPNPPTGLYGDFIGTDSFFLGWTASVTDSTHDAPTSYDIGVSSSNSIPPSTLITTGNPSPGEYKNELIANTDNYELIDGLSPNTNYYGYVRAKNSGGTSSWAVSAAIKTNALKPPNNITNLVHDSLAAGKNSLNFDFTAPVEDTTHNLALTYRYSYNTSNTAPSGTSTGDYETVDNTPSITIGDAFFNPLTPDTTYYIFIKAKNNDGLSSTWVTASGKTKADLNPPTQATNLSVTNRSPSGFDFSWTANGGSATSFKVAYNTTGTTPTSDGFSEGLWYDTLSTATSFRFQGLNAGTTYYAFVKGYNNDGEAVSARSGTITTLAAPSFSNPTWNSSNFQRTAYSQYTTQKSRTTTVITVYKDDSGSNTSNPGNIRTVYSTTNNTSVTLANLGTGYDGARTVSGAFSNRITANVNNSTSQALTNDTDGTITGNTRLRWGFDDGTYTSSGSGTYAAITNGGVQYEIYDAASGGNYLEGGSYSYDFSLDTPQVNSVSYYHVFLSGRDGTLSNYAAPIYMRIRAYGTDYDGKYYYATWSSRI